MAGIIANTPFDLFGRNVLKLHGLKTKNGKIEISKKNWASILSEALKTTIKDLESTGATAKDIKNVIYANTESDVYKSLYGSRKKEGTPQTSATVRGFLDKTKPLVEKLNEAFINNAKYSNVMDVINNKMGQVPAPTEDPSAPEVKQKNQKAMRDFMADTQGLIEDIDEEEKKMQLELERQSQEHEQSMKDRVKRTRAEVEKILKRDLSVVISMREKLKQHRDWVDEMKGEMDKLKTQVDDMTLKRQVDAELSSLTSMRERLKEFRGSVETAASDAITEARKIVSDAQLKNIERDAIANLPPKPRRPSLPSVEPEPIPPKPTLPPKPTKQPKPDPTPPKPPLPPRPPKPPPEEPLKPPVTITPAPTENFVVVKKGGRGRGGKKGGSVDTYREGLLRQAVKDVQDIHDKASRSSNPERFSDQLNRALRTVFELKTGIDLSKVPRDGQTIKTMGDILDSTLQTVAGAAQEFGISEKGLKFLGSHKGGMEGLVRDDEPLNLLDGIAKRHDLEYLIASTERDSEKQQEVQRHADQAMLDEIEKLLPKLDPRSNQYKDSSAVYKAISTKMFVDSNLKKTGISPSAWLVTPNVEKLDPKSIPDRFSRLADVMQRLSKDLNDVVDPSEQVSEQPYEDYVRQYGGPLTVIEEIEEVHPPEPTRQPYTPEPVRGPYTHPPEVGGGSPVPPVSGGEVKEPEVGGVVRDGDGGVKVGPELTVYNQQAVKKVPMTLDGLLGELQKMNSGSKDPSNIYSLKPVTGERNMRPLLVKADYAGVLNRTKKEEEDNMTFYAKWKNIESGWGNGNQEALPDQILPAKNTVLRAQRENENYKFSDNFDGGARNWYEETYRPAMKKQMIVHSKRVNSKWAVPMIRNNQTHQLPVRNGALPAGAGRPIQFSRDTQNGFDIYTPYQRLNARQTRLFNGDVVDGRRV